MIEQRGAASGRDPARRGLVLRYLADETGQAATEYILVIGVIVLPLAVAYIKLQDVLKDVLKDIARLLSGPGV